MFTRLSMLTLLVALLLPIATHAQDIYGLSAWYYHDRSFSGSSIYRVDETVHFNWGRDAPMEQMEGDTFQVRWKGMLTAQYTEELTLITVSDDGVRLWFDGKLLIDQWNNHSARTDYATVDVVAGQSYSIMIEYYEQGGNAVLQFEWESDHLIREVVPSYALTPWGENNESQGILGIQFNRNHIYEGESIQLTAYRDKDLDQQLRFALVWEGDAVDHLHRVYDDITIQAYDSSARLNVRLKDNDLFQGNQELTVRAYLVDDSGEIIQNEGLQDHIMVRDDEVSSDIEYYTLTGEVYAPVGSLIKVTAQGLSDGSENDEEIVQAGQRYGLEVPEGEYRMTVTVLLRGEDDWQNAWLEDGSFETVIHTPPHHFEINWWLMLPESEVDADIEMTQVEDRDESGDLEEMEEEDIMIASDISNLDDMNPMTESDMTEMVDSDQMKTNREDEPNLEITKENQLSTRSTDTPACQVQIQNQSITPPLWLIIFTLVGILTHRSPRTL